MWFVDQLCTATFNSELSKKDHFRSGTMWIHNSCLKSPATAKSNTNKTFFQLKYAVKQVANIWFPPSKCSITWQCNENSDMFTEHIGLKTNLVISSSGTKSVNNESYLTSLEREYHLLTSHFRNWKWTILTTWLFPATAEGVVFNTGWSIKWRISL